MHDQSTGGAPSPDLLHVIFGLLWFGFAAWGLATDAPMWAIASWTLAAGIHLGRMIERLP